MPSNIVEVLVVKSANRQTFTINTSATEVDIDVGGGGAPVRYLEDVYGRSYFKRCDSPLILGAGLQLPYSYCLSTVPVYLSLTWVDDSGSGQATAGAIQLPTNGDEVSLVGGPGAPGLFLQHPGLTNPLGPAWTGRARLALSVITGKVSMVNNPSTLSGSLSVIPYLRVQHNFDLES